MTPYGGGIKGGLYHSQSTEASLLPHGRAQSSGSVDPRGRPRAFALGRRRRGSGVVPRAKRIYRSLTGEVPDGDARIPFGQARLARQGSDVSLFAYGAMLPIALEAAEMLAPDGISAEVVDLRSLVPLDVESGH